ncbi:hypothetical protein K456DRAFT_30047 [Colletotrichum gloeosporioides 23]|nr:hypothetical protein K456DRAFT_30047 [Colletotrichum gloeosporioides 23]
MHKEGELGEEDVVKTERNGGGDGGGGEGRGCLVGQCTSNGVSAMQYTQCRNTSPVAPEAQRRVRKASGTDWGKFPTKKPITRPSILSHPCTWPGLAQWVRKQTGQAPARQDGRTVLSVFVQYKTTNTRNNYQPPSMSDPDPRPVSIVPVPTVQSFCVPSFTALGQAWHFDATSSRQPAHRYMLDNDDGLGSSCMHCSAVQYSNVSLKPGVLLVTVTA